MFVYEKLFCKYVRWIYTSTYCSRMERCDDRINIVVSENWAARAKLKQNEKSENNKFSLQRVNKHKIIYIVHTYIEEKSIHTAGKCLRNVYETLSEKLVENEKSSRQAKSRSVCPLSRLKSLDVKFSFSSFFFFCKWDKQRRNYGPEFHPLLSLTIAAKWILVRMLWCPSYIAWISTKL